MNNQSTAAGETGRQYNGKIKMSMTFSKIIPWHWPDQPNRNRDKPRPQHQQRFKPSTFRVKVLCSTNKHMLLLLSVIIHSKLDFQNTKLCK